MIDIIFLILVNIIWFVFTSFLLQNRRFIMEEASKLELLIVEIIAKDYIKDQYKEEVKEKFNPMIAKIKILREGNV